MLLLRSRCLAVVCVVAGAACSSETVAPPITSQTHDETSSGSVLTPTSGGAIIDASGNVWTLTGDGRVQENGADVPGGHGTSSVAYVNGQIYGQDAASGNWYAFTNGTWVGPQASPVSTPSAPAVSASGTTVPPATQIVDAQNNVWTLVASGNTSGNQIALNGTIDPITQQVELLLYYQDTFYQQSIWGWYLWNGSGWTQVAADPRTPSQTTSGIRWGCSIDANYLQPIVNNGFTPGMGDFYVWDTYGGSLAVLVDGIDNYLSTVQALNQEWGVVPLWSLGMGNGAQDFDDIANGAYDAVWQHAVSATAALGIEKFYVRPGWEMNGTWFTWSVNADNSSSFINAWRHIYQVVHSQAAASGVTVLVDYAPASGNDDALCWPGPDFVDVISLDTGSLLYSDVSNDAPLATDVVSTLTMAQRAVAYGKPFGISELAADNGEWSIVLQNHLRALQMAPGVELDHFCFTNWETNVNGSTAYQSSPPDNAAVQSFMTAVSDL